MKTIKKLLVTFLLCLVAAIGFSACEAENNNNGNTGAETGKYWHYGENGEVVVW